MTTQLIASHEHSVAQGNVGDTDYHSDLEHLQGRFLALVENGKSPLFTTDAEGLWEAYIGSFPESERQYHNCNACRHFVSRFGGLVTIDESGSITSAFWDEYTAQGIDRAGILAMAKILRKAKVTGVFLSSELTLGIPRTGLWIHLSVTLPKSMLFRPTLHTAGQVMAEKREDYRNVSRALGEFSLPMLEQALTLLNSDALYRSEKVIGPAQWLHDLHVARNEVKGPNAKANVTWKAIATAPAGFCHPRSSMIGTLLEDIAAGMDFDDVSRRFKAKMHPLQYQRPQAAPAAGNIAAAEKIVAQLGVAGALRRRYARIDEVEALWSPKPAQAQPANEGVFGHLKAKGMPVTRGDMSIPAQTMTWDKFSRTVLPTADAIEFYTPANDNFTAFLTAADPDAPAILQWDSEEARNPVSWYVWHGGSSPSQYGLKANTFNKVSAVTLKPSMWHGAKSSNQGEGVVFLLEGARETRKAGLALFPECLKSEFHGIRSTIEAYSRRGEPEGIENSSACGVMLSKGKTWNARVRVTTKGQTVEYKLDRWD